MLIHQYMRMIGRALQRYHWHEPLSQLVWLGCVIIFAIWTQANYQAPPGAVPWIGMTIRCSVFAIIGQVVREWLALRWEQ